MNIDTNPENTRNIRIYLKKCIQPRMIFYNYFEADPVKILLMISFISSIGINSR